MRQRDTAPLPTATHLRWWQLFAACLTGLLIPLCFTGPAVVLPSISQALGGSAAQLNWIINGYILTYGSAMMVSGSLTDLIGPRRVWLSGLIWFSIVTLAIPWAPSVLWIDVLRLLQGLGGAAAFAAAMSSLAPLFSGVARTRVFSLIGTTFGIGLAFGPLAAGALVDAASWHWIFWSTGLIGVGGVVLVALSVKASAPADTGGLDWPGAITFTAALSQFTYAILQAPEQGWRTAAVAGSLAAALVLFVAFVLIERHVARPMLDVSLFRRPRFVGVQLLAASPAFLFIVLIVMLPGRLIGIDGYSALVAGQMMVGLAAPLLVVPVGAALLARTFSTGHLSGAGLLLAAAGLAWMAHTPAAAWSMPMGLIGIGIGLPWGLMDAMAVSVVEPERAGMATGIFNTVRICADGVAIATIGALTATLIQSDLLRALSGRVADGAIVAAGNRMALGELSQAVSLLPGQQALLLHSYDDAFRVVLYCMAALAVGVALAAFALLGGIHAHDAGPDTA
ncbi:MFS transporter [Massilia sp. CCM 8733]|uniref:MFS transporter n=1 Tax=Massilia mucilaginosa TaxID=2609282 RepID=A0ABX0P417_9BURK|nr:MFS transporter [Massilia mucilaginosa]NHZ93793.1 MFS transporter [Massilia mucilaginosa]